MYILRFNANGNVLKQSYMFIKLDMGNMFNTK